MKNSEINSGRALPKSPFPPILAPLLDNPLRRAIFNRERFIREMGIKEGDIVLEVGCGPGFFTEIISKVVGTGRVYAQDVEEAMIKRVKGKLSSFIFQNVSPLLCNSTNTPLEDGSIDVVFCANVFDEIYLEGMEELEGTIREIDRVLKKGGIMVLKEHRPFGTAKAVKEAAQGFLRLNYTKVYDKKTWFSHHIKFIKV